MSRLAQGVGREAIISAPRRDLNAADFISRWMGAIRKIRTNSIAWYCRAMETVTSQ
jgi:hypothetical protein